MKIGYARVSTYEQNLDRQIDALKEAGCERIFAEKVSTGQKERPELNRLLDFIRKDDSVIICELTRLGRTVKDLIEIVEKIHSIGAHLVSIQEKWMDTTSVQGSLIFNMFAAFAQFERDLTRQRVKNGLEAARARGRKGGRPPVPADKADLAVRMYKSNSCPIADIIKATGLGRSTIYRLVNKQRK